MTMNSNRKCGDCIHFRGQFTGSCELAEEEDDACEYFEGSPVGLFEEERRRCVDCGRLLWACDEDRCSACEKEYAKRMKRCPGCGYLLEDWQFCCRSCYEREKSIQAEEVEP
jgi:hypothetical protein